MIILGAPGVGKTSLIQRYIHDVFDIQVPQQSMQEEDKLVDIRNRQVKLKICDMAGKKSNVEMPLLEMYIVHCVIIMCTS